MRGEVLFKTSLNIIKAHKIYGLYYSKDMPMMPIMRIIVTNNTLKPVYEEDQRAQAFAAAPRNSFLANATEKRSLVDMAVKKDISSLDSDGTSRKVVTDLPIERFALGFAITLAVVEVRFIVISLLVGYHKGAKAPRTGKTAISLGIIFDINSKAPRTGKTVEFERFKAQASSKAPRTGKTAGCSLCCFRLLSKAPRTGQTFSRGA